jgi:hypothetical protein
MKHTSSSTKRNYKIASNSHFLNNIGTTTTILVRDNLWIKNTNNQTHIALFNRRSPSESHLDIYNVNKRVISNTLRLSNLNEINFVLHIPNTSHIILWSNNRQGPLTGPLWGLTLWSLSTNKQIKMAHINESRKFGLDLDPNDSLNQFVTISADWSSNWINVKTWNSNTFTCLRTLRFQSCNVALAHINYYTNQLIAFTYNGRLKIWNMVDRNDENFIRLHKKYNLYASNDGLLLCLLVRKIKSKHQFVTCHELFERHSLIIEMWTEEKVNSCLARKKLYKYNPGSFERHRVSLFDLNTNEFASVHHATGGAVKIWSWNTGVCLKSLNTEFINITSCVYDPFRQSLFFTRNKIVVFHLQSKYYEAYLNELYLCSKRNKSNDTNNNNGEVLQKGLSLEQKLDYGVLCLTGSVMTNLIVDGWCRFI